MLFNNKNIDIVSLSTACSFEDNEKIKELLISNGFNPFFSNQRNVSIPQEVNNFFANIDPKERLVNFKQAIENPYSSIIWCNRGGYGSADILPLLYEMPRPNQSKVFIGFSDAVVIANFVQQNWGWKVICAPMLHQILYNKVSLNSQRQIFNLISGKITQLNYDLKLLKGSPQDLVGEIVGGCISVLSSNFATKNQINWHNKILFLEDEGEDGERLERYFTQIAYMINDSAIPPRAILLGNFAENNEFGTVNRSKIDIAIHRFCQKIDHLPIWQESIDCLGHAFNQQPLILGIDTQINRHHQLIQKLI